MNDKIVFAAGGFLEGWPGDGDGHPPATALPESPYIDASANINVAKVDVKSLESGRAAARGGGPAGPAGCGSTRSVPTASVSRCWSRRN